MYKNCRYYYYLFFSSLQFVLTTGLSLFSSFIVSSPFPKLEKQSVDTLLILLLILSLPMIPSRLPLLLFCCIHPTSRWFFVTTAALAVFVPWKACTQTWWKIVVEGSLRMRIMKDIIIDIGHVVFVIVDMHDIPVLLLFIVNFILLETVEIGVSFFIDISSTINIGSLA